MLDKIDFDVAAITKEEYKPVHDDLVKKLIVLQQEARTKGIGLVVLFEGWDGAGKGGRISDLLYNLDARSTTVHVSENFDLKEAKQLRKQKQGMLSYYPVLQQFWKALGPRGNMTIYDRGWYRAVIQRIAGRKAGVAVEDVSEGGAHWDLSQEALKSTKAFERQLTDDGYIVVKFFLHISKRTQRKRLKALASDPQTAWRVEEGALESLGDYDEKCAIYERFLPETNYDFAPWVVLNAEDPARWWPRLTGPCTPQPTPRPPQPRQRRPPTALVWPNAMTRTSAPARPRSSRRSASPTRRQLPSRRPRLRRSRAIALPAIIRLSRASTTICAWSRPSTRRR